MEASPDLDGLNPISSDKMSVLLFFKVFFGYLTPLFLKVDGLSSFLWREAAGIVPTLTISASSTVPVADEEKVAGLFVWLVFLGEITAGEKVGKKELCSFHVISA